MKHRSTRSRRRIGVLAGLVALAALAGGGLVANSYLQPRSAGIWRSPAHGAGSTAPSSPAIDPAATPSASVTPSPTSPKAPNPNTPGSAYAHAVLDQTNAWRAAAGLRPYTMASGLVESARKHNTLMVQGCGVSHQCPGERGVGDRISAAGIRWDSFGENCGLRGWFSNSPGAISNAGKQVNQDFFNEGPGGGHHDALVSRTYTRIGIDVQRDKDGLVFVTEDFAN